MKAVKVLSVLFLAACPVLWLKALWTVGDDAGRYGFTGLLALAVGGVLTAIWTMP